MTDTAFRNQGWGNATCTYEAQNSAPSLLHHSIDLVVVVVLLPQDSACQSHAHTLV